MMSRAATDVPEMRPRQSHDFVRLDYGFAVRAAKP
jgi:hypothetical protein